MFLNLKTKCPTMSIPRSQVPHALKDCQAIEPDTLQQLNHGPSKSRVLELRAY